MAIASAIIGGVIAGAGAIGAAAIGSSAQKKAANQAVQAQTDTTAANNQLAREIYSENKSVLAPYVQTGTNAGNALNALLGLGGTAQQQQQYQNAFNNYQNSTGYDFRFDQGMRGVNAMAAAGGYRDSGAAVKSAMQFGQGIASDEYNNYLAHLANQQGVGLSAAGAQAGVGTNYVSAISNNNNAAASALGNAALLRGQANSNLWSSAANALGNIGGSLFESSFK